MNSKKILCMTLLGLIILILIVGMMRSSTSDDENEIVITKVSGCQMASRPMIEPLSYMSKNPKTKEQEMRYAKRMKVEQSLKEGMGPIYQQDTENAKAMRMKPVSKEYFTNSFTYTAEPPSLRSPQNRSQSPFIGEIPDS